MVTAKRNGDGPRPLGTHDDVVCPGKRVGSWINVCNFLSSYQKKEMSVADLCRAYGILRPTGYRWINSYKETGPEGLVDRSPHSCSHATLKPNRRRREITISFGRRRQNLSEWPGSCVPMETPMKIFAAAFCALNIAMFFPSALYPQRATERPNFALRSIPVGSAVLPAPSQILVANRCGLWFWKSLLPRNRQGKQKKSGTCS